MKLEILYEDSDIIAYNKPSGLLSIPHRFEKSLPSLHQLAEHKLDAKLMVIHRIDRDTSGAIIFAKNEVAHRHYSMAFQNREVGKKYRALCVGVPAKDADVIQNGIMEHPTIKGKMVVNRRGKPAHSAYTVIEHWNGYAHLEVEIFTGRTHQIRVHMQSIGTPIIHDEIYGDGKALYLSDFKKKYKLSQHEEEETPLMGRLALHAYKLRLPNLHGDTIEIMAPEPKDFRATISQLNKWNPL